jgi:hypothetical protein
VDAAAHYRQLLQLGRDEFLASAAPAALVRYRALDQTAIGATHTLTLDQDYPDDASVDGTLPFGKEMPPEVDLEVYPLTKKAGASFADRITIGRTANNDVVINDSSVSRLHAYIRRDGNNWLVADAGSKNGSWLRATKLEARRETQLPSRTVLRIGEVELTFYTAADLFAALGGS